jgi:hypothetical protein
VTPGKPLKLVLQNGKYSCEGCNTNIKDLSADGRDHEVSGSDYYDMKNISIVDSHTIKEVSKKKGKVVNEITSTVSNDGATMKFTGKQFLDSGKVTNNSGTFRRVSAGPPGSHSISGDWAQTDFNTGEEFSEWIYKFNPDGSLTYDDKLGIVYTAKFDGKDYPVKGDPGTPTVALKKINDRTFEEHYKDKTGKVVLISHTVISADGKHGDVDNENKVTGDIYHFKVVKK